MAYSSQSGIEVPIANVMDDSQVDKLISGTLTKAEQEAISHAILQYLVGEGFGPENGVEGIEGWNIDTLNPLSLIVHLAQKQQ